MTPGRVPTPSWLLHETWGEQIIHKEIQEKLCLFFEYRNQGPSLPASILGDPLASTNMSMELVPPPSPAKLEPKIIRAIFFCSRDTRHNKDNHYLTLLRVEALLVFLACSLMFLGVFGAFRRCCINRGLDLFGFLAYTISFTAIAYTLGLNQNATFCHELFPIGALFLMVALGSAVSYTVHSLQDVERWRSFKIEWVNKCYMVAWVIPTYVPVVPVYLLILALMKVDDRIRALMSASRDVMQKNCIFLADYMKTEHLCSDPNQVDPCSLRDYKYYVSEAKETKAHLCFLPAFWRKRQRWLEGAESNYQVSLCMTNDVITVEKVWNCGGRLLSATGGQLKDLCLSFSLFNLIRLRFAGYSFPREAHDKLWSLQRCLLSEENGYERFFRVIEVELAFLFDLLYTNISITPSPRRFVVEILLLVLLLTFFVAIISFYKPSPKSSDRSTLLTLLMMVAILVIKIVQFGISIFSEWAKVVYFCVYVRNDWCQKSRIVEKLIEIMCRVKLRKPWGRQLRQYSLLKKCSYSPSKLIYNRFTAPYFNQKRDGQQDSAPTRLSTEVVKAITRSLMNNGTRYLENGRASLRRNNVFDQLSWACDFESTTCVIMVWHIATSICEHEQRPQGQRDNFNIAIMLSRYLAYLVAYAPRLLPVHPFRTEYIFDCVVKEARGLSRRSYRTEYICGNVVRKASELFRGRWISMDERIQKLEVLDDETYGGTIVGQGARLGKLFIEAKDEEHSWTVLADFWAEMMLYVAPSNDAWTHAKYLATGGEFVSHVWVLLSHSGIMRSPQGGEQHDVPERY